MPTQPATLPEKEELPIVQRIVSVLWPSFLTAGVATIIFFTLFDPVELSQLRGGPEISRLAGYTFGFFCFWLLTASSCALTCYFRRPCPPRKTLPPTEDADTDES
jgi:hypothetical protein